jgi:GNAT superfamily N-acetyltransferase
MSDFVTIVEADLSQPDHQRDVLAMTAVYAMDIMGDNAPLAPDVLERLIPGLISFPTTIIFLAYDNDAAVGIATCFLGFSTFMARPLINIHDLAVLFKYRGQGISRKLMQAVENKARELGCAKITLEVLEDNQRARHVYETAGFHHATLGQNKSGMLFYTKQLKDA